MVNGLFDFGSGSRNFRLKRNDSCLQFLNGQGIQILALKRDQWIIDTLRKEIVGVHERKGRLILAACQ